MGGIKPEHYEKEDPNNPGYSQTEYDLYARIGLAIRKNLKDDCWELYHIKTKEVHHTSPQLENIVEIANELEGEKNTWIV
jgi:hypothetical protein